MEKDSSHDGFGEVVVISDAIFPHSTSSNPWRDSLPTPNLLALEHPGNTGWNQVSKAGYPSSAFIMRTLIQQLDQECAQPPLVLLRDQATQTSPVPTTSFSTNPLDNGTYDDQPSAYQLPLTTIAHTESSHVGARLTRPKSNLPSTNKVTSRIIFSSAQISTDSCFVLNSAALHYPRAPPPPPRCTFDAFSHSIPTPEGSRSHGDLELLLAAVNTLETNIPVERSGADDWPSGSAVGTNTTGTTSSGSSEGGEHSYRTGDADSQDNHFSCSFEYCSEHFPTHSELSAHMKAHLTDRSYRCPFVGCLRAFSQSGGLVRHSRTHTGEKPFKCEHENCSKEFTEAGHLTRHSRSHTGEKPFDCSYDCGKTFTTLYHLTRHTRVHTGEKPFSCAYPGCQKSFTQSGGLNRHARTHGNFPGGPGPVRKRNQSQRAAGTMSESTANLAKEIRPSVGNCENNSPMIEEDESEGDEDDLGEVYGSDGSD